MEQWKDIEGFEGIYQVSNLGRIRSLDRIERNTLGQNIKRKGKMLKPVANSSGYLRVILRHEGKSQRSFVHRLVAKAFCYNSNEECNTVVNHIDSDYLNNKASNLEWTTMKGNSQHALKSGRMERTQQWRDKLKKSLEWKNKPIEAYDPETNEIIEKFDKLSLCKNKGYDPPSVCMCCKGKRKLHRGLRWRYGERK
ncbi:NUMOD4 domain-containing protein [Ruminococcus sp.]|uniref:NUMOD4 domain-containing protein n=1 Tax=Ruminococcus sp. TaxID=41978 RepID=UPI001B6E4DBA|nr:NUMOD4 domain-containing protein [Ruminococcus sp.]MBP5431094.1 HNH endonuclease [Ruminococcus sp.]